MRNAEQVAVDAGEPITEPDQRPSAEPESEGGSEAPRGDGAPAEGHEGTDGEREAGAEPEPEYGAGDVDYQLPLGETRLARLRDPLEWLWPASTALSLLINGAVIALLIFPLWAAAPEEPEPIPVDIVQLAPPPPPEPPQAEPPPAPQPPVVEQRAPEPLPPPPKKHVQLERKPKPRPAPALTPRQRAPSTTPPVETETPPPQEAALPPPETSAESESAIKTYAGRLRALIEAKKSYPAQALRRQEEGSVNLHILLDRDGKLVQVTATSSAPEVLVNAAIAAVREAAPFPSFPKELDHAHATFELPIVFHLD